jgi:uncharacterized damage-inducible protein DinB
MGTKENFEFLSQYNAWANNRLYVSCGALNKEELNQNRLAYFGSIINTLNHILVADRLWLSRFKHEVVEMVDLGAVLYTEFKQLKAAREKEDKDIIGFIRSQNEDTLSKGVFSYMDTRGYSLEAEYNKALIHFFNHQTHHRGQVHTMISQAEKEPPELDILYFYQEQS